jgi:hypothetical protein
MFHLKPEVGGRTLMLVLAWGLVLFPLHVASAQEDRMEIVGDYRYFYHDPVSSAEARNIAYTEAVRLAIDSSRIFIDTTRSVMDPQLLNHLKQVIASGYLKDLQVLEESEKGRTVRVKVRATINPQEIKTVLEREINRGQGKEPPGLDQNRALKILSVREESDGTVAVVFKALKRLDWLNTAYDGSLRETADVMIDFYDEQGVPIGTERFPARKSSNGDMMNPGEIGVAKFTKPSNARSYRAWLVK